MSMTNFLPWRQQRRMRCLRFWGLMFAVMWLLMLMVVYALKLSNTVKLHALQAQLTSAQSVQQVLVSRQRKATLPLTPARPLHHLAWQPVLESLSRVMPPQAWLTELRYQPPSLVFIGYATALPALSALRDALRNVAGFTSGPAGELQQDSQGRWMFTFQLQRQE